ncbi:MAG TPA: phosphatidate cytidylyltransferase [Leptospiraceae bacterium]|nr:phosphatidate cytidylyltransferase [Spirochaetaceae bacterium]HBS05508.1 phosphatidate cytidylyltransferase [Leptospiraceae bacterium]|tara:strand:- start:59566 stop:60465 length:900 start_codon:yes stop_codon:yes gene_type:complete
MGETTKRIISGLTIGAVVIVALYYNTAFYSAGVVILVGLVSFLGVEEFYRLSDRGLEGKPLRLPGFLMMVLILVNFYLMYAARKHPELALASGLPAQWFTPWTGTFPMILIISVIFTASLQLVFRPIDGAIFSASTTIFAPLYVALPLAMIFPLFQLKMGVFYFVFIALATIMTDAGAYFAGKWFGKHNAGLKVSPRKTYEGYIGGVVFAVAFNQGFLYSWQHFTGHGGHEMLGYVEAGVLTAVLSVVSVFGDLVESQLKRDAKIKDSASMIPGHGGILDLIDALLFTIPLGTVYFLYR